MRGDGVTPAEPIPLPRSETARGTPVDDAHLLDDASAGLVLLAAQSRCGVIAAIRRGESCPDAITLLWTNDFVSRLDLQPLDREEVGEVLAAALGAPVDSHTRREQDVLRFGAPDRS